MKEKISLGIIIIVFLGVAYYAISPLLRDVEVHDEVPERVDSQSAQFVPSGFENLSEEKQKELLDIIADVNVVPAPPALDDMPPIINDSAVEIKESFKIMATGGHPAEGSVRVIETADGPVIRYEDFSTINGPNLHVYLATSLDASDHIDLGPIRGTSGDINYTVPEGVDLREYKYVMYWCVPFSILFNYAELEI